MVFGLPGLGFATEPFDGDELAESCDVEGLLPSEPAQPKKVNVEKAQSKAVYLNFLLMTTPCEGNLLTDCL